MNAKGEQQHAPLPDLDREDLVDRMETTIERLAQGRVRNLHVTWVDDWIVLQGRSKTYHAAQLALEVAHDLAGRGPVVTSHIVVG